MLYAMLTLRASGEVVTYEVTGWDQAGLLKVRRLGQ